MPTRNVFLSKHFDTCIASGIETGRYSNASEVMRDGLRPLERRDAAQEGINSLDRGEGKSFGSIDEMVDHIRQISRSQRRQAECLNRLLLWRGFPRGPRPISKTYRYSPGRAT